MQTTDRGVIETSTALEGTRIAIAVTGSIAAVEVVKIIRELRRRSAQTTAFMTLDAKKFISPLSLEWASNRPVIHDDDPNVVHLEPFDIVLIAPATFNTISKAALGLADNPVTLVIAAQLGRRGKLLFVPTMNRDLVSHPGFRASEARLKDWRAGFFWTDVEEDRLKMPDPVLLVDQVERELALR